MLVGNSDHVRNCWYLRTTISRVHREWFEKEKTRYKQGMQSTISEHTTRGTLKKMGSSRRSHRMPLLSPKNRKQRPRLTQVHQNWTIEDWNNVVWSDGSRFQLLHSDGRVRIWLKQHESVDPSGLASTLQAAAGGVMVWGILCWHTLDPLVPIKLCINAAACLVWSL